MDNSSKKKMAPALHNTDHEHDTVTIKHCFKVPPESPESALTVRNDGIYTKMNGSYSPLSPVSDDVHEAATDIDQSIKATNRPLAHAVQSSVSPYSNRGDSGDFVCRGNQEQGYKTPHKNDICQSQAQPCGDGLPAAPKSNGWPHKLQSDEASVNSKLNGGKNHVLLTENQGTDQRHTEINGRTSESSLNDPTEVHIKTTSDLNTKSSIANSYSTTIKSVLHSLNASSVAINEMIPRDEYTDQQLKNGEQIESDSLQVLSNPTTTPVEVDSVPMDVAEPQQTTNLKISDNVESTKDLMCTPFTCVQTVDVNSSLTKSSSVQTSMSHLNSSLNSEASGFCSKLHAGSGDPSNLCSQAETIVTYKSSSPISSHCVYDHNTETVEHQDLKSNMETDFNTPDILGLAHGLITGNHMQHLPLKLTNTLQELAASLTRSQTENTGSCCPHKTEPIPARRRSSKSLNFETECSDTASPVSNLNEIRSRHHLQYDDANKRRISLEGRLNFLSRRLNRIRAAGLSKHVSKQLSDVSDSMKPEKHLNLTLKSSPLQTSLKAKDLEVWRNILSRKLSDRRPFITDCRSFNNVVPSEGSGAFKPDPVLWNECNSQEIDPYKQIKHRTGVVKKELQHLASVYDADLTDSSSDEETTDTVYRGGNCYYPCNQGDTTSARSHDLKEHKRSITSSAAWYWANERTSVAKRWTWLQAQVNDLEFKIRQHTEMHRQMRIAKGQLEFGEQLPSTSKELVVDNTSPATPQPSTNFALKQEDIPSSLEKGTDSPSPFNISKLVKNVHRQTSNLLDNLSPLSVTTPSPSEKKLSEIGSSAVGAPEKVLEIPYLPSSDSSVSAARTRPLRSMLRKRRIVRSGDIELLTNKRMKPPSVPNDASIMCGQFEQQTPFQRCDGRFLHSVPASFSVRAAIHDHSYHKTLSSKQDVPLSLRLSSFMCNNTKWCKEKKSGRERQEKKKSKRKQKASKQEERAKHRTRSATFVIEKSDKIIRSMSTLQRYTSMDERPLDSRKRRGSVQLMAEFNKRNRVASVDSDLEAHQYRSGASTPTELSLTHSGSSVQMQALMKRKRLADQAYDINNIVIPQHGLTATRIEKLQYKEILTPGWRVSAENEAKSKDDAEETEEDLVDSSYQTRHDRYEILEKKKYVAYMEWSMSKKNGTRVMSRANLPTTSPFFDNPALRDSPSPRIGSPEIPTPSSPDELNIGSPAALVRSRRSSSDHNIHRASVLVTPVPDVKLPLRESLSSEDGRPPRAYPVVESWKERKFPLNDEDFEDLMKTPVVENAPSFSNRFRPIARSGTDTNTAFKYKTPKSGDVVPAKRRRTDSTLSSMSRDDDRHSDGSNTSSYSARPAASRKEISPSQPRRHKPMVKPDFYVYSDIESDSAETTDSAEEEPLISGDDRPGSNYRHASTHWFAKPMDTPSSPPTPRTPTVEQKGPLLLKIKKK